MADRIAGKKRGLPSDSLILSPVIKRPGRGGYRPGAGRKKGDGFEGRVPKRKLYASPIREAEGKIRDRLPELVDEAIRQALEDHSEVQTRYCIDRILGKPAQPIGLDVQRAAERLAAVTGADPEFLIRRAQQLAAEHSEAGTGS